MTKFEITAKHINEDRSLNKKMIEKEAGPLNDVSELVVSNIEKEINLDLGIFSHLKVLSCKKSLVRSINKIPKSLTELNVLYCENIKTINLSNARRLTWLDCEGSSIKSIKNFPASLEELSVKDCQNIETLDLLKTRRLIRLDCDGSSIESIKNFPTSLKKLSVKDCHNIETLDLLNAAGLTELNCFRSSITSIKNFPASLKKLSVINCQNIETLDLLNAAGLTKFNYKGSSIESIKNFPASLEELSVKDCQNIETLDLLNATGLTEIDCEGSAIKSIKNFPASLKRLGFKNCRNIETLDLLNATGLTELNCKGSSIKSINNFPISLKKLSVAYCENIRTLDLLNTTGLTEIDCEGSAIKSINNFPASLKKLGVKNCQKIETLDLLNAAGLTELRCKGSSIKSINNFPASLKKLGVINCQKIKTLDLLNATGLTILSCKESSIESINNFPTSLKKLSVINCQKIKTLDLSNATGLTELHCKGSSIKSITNLPDSLTFIDLSNCNKLDENDQLRAQLERLQDRGCVVSIPSGWRKLESCLDKAKAKVDKIPNNLESLKKLLNRFLGEETASRIPEQIVTNVNILFDMFDRGPNNLEWANDVAKTFLTGCINQPNAGFDLIMSWMSIMNLPKESPLLDKIEMVKRVLVMQSIRQNATEIFKVEGVQVEMGNLLFIRVHEELVKEGIIKESEWIGLTKNIAYAGTVKDNIKNDTNKILTSSCDLARDIMNCNPKKLIEFINEEYCVEDVRNIDIFITLIDLDLSKFDSEKVKEKYQEELVVLSDELSIEQGNAEKILDDLKNEINPITKQIKAELKKREDEKTTNPDLSTKTLNTKEEIKITPDTIKSMTTDELNIVLKAKEKELENQKKKITDLGEHFDKRFKKLKEKYEDIKVLAFKEKLRQEGYLGKDDSQEDGLPSTSITDTSVTQTQTSAENQI